MNEVKFTRKFSPYNSTISNAIMDGDLENAIRKTIGLPDDCEVNITKLEVDCSVDKGEVEFIIKEDGEYINGDVVLSRAFE